MVIGLWWMAHQDGVHLRIRSQNWFKYKLAVKTGSQQRDRYDSWIWPRSVNKSITVRQIDNLIDWRWRMFGWTQWSIRDKEESGIYKHVFVFQKICCFKKEKQQWRKTLCVSRETLWHQLHLSQNVFRVGRDINVPKALRLRDTAVSHERISHNQEINSAIILTSC